MNTTDDTSATAAAGPVLSEELGWRFRSETTGESTMTWYDVLWQVQGSGDQRRIAMLIAAMWQALADGPEWTLTNSLMNTYPLFNLSSNLDGAQVGVSAAARALVR